MLKPILIATLAAGTLDLLSAFAFSAMVGATPGQVLGFVASGPFGDAMLTAPLGIPLGLLVHFTLMLAMVAAYFVVAPRVPALLRHPVVAGLLYGLVLWGIMYWIVRPLRWPAMPSATAGGVVGVAKQLFSHCILVGLPIALIAARYFDSGTRPAPARAQR